MISVGIIFIIVAGISAIIARASYSLELADIFVYGTTMAVLFSGLGITMIIFELITTQIKN